MGWVIFVEFECMDLAVYAFKMLHFSVLVVFGKSFVFAKMSKISKTVLSCFGDLVAGGHTEIFRGSLASQCPSRKI